MGARELCAFLEVCQLWQAVCVHRQGQSVECLENPIWCLNFPIQRVIICPERGHLLGRQVHRDGLWRQESHRLRNHVLDYECKPIFSSFYLSLLVYSSYVKVLCCYW